MGTGRPEIPVATGGRPAGNRAKPDSWSHHTSTNPKFTVARESIEVPAYDVNRAELEAFAAAAAGGAPFPISHQQMIHGVAVTEAVLASARSSRVETVA